MVCGGCQTRVKIGGMICLASLVASIVQGNMSIAIIAMTKPVHNSSSELPNYGPRYEWSVYDQSLVIGSYFWGFAGIACVSGVFAERYGPRNIVGYSLIIATILSAITPIAASLLWLSILIRFLTGLAMGTVYPSLQALISNWVPPEEKGKFLATLLSHGLGTVIVWSFSGATIVNLGWVYVFYIVAIILGISTVVWFLNVRDSPSKHPQISDAERKYILRSLQTTTVKKKVIFCILFGLTTVVISTFHCILNTMVVSPVCRNTFYRLAVVVRVLISNSIKLSEKFANINMPWPPLRAIFLSTPFWALIFFHFGCVWCLFFFLTAAPKYLNEVHNFSIAVTGFLGSIPCLVRLAGGILFGFIGDLLMKKKAMSPNSIRKVFSLCSHIIPGFGLIGLMYVGNQPYVCVGLITIALGFNGAVVITSLQNSHDLSPNFAPTIFGITQSFSTTPGFLAPLVVAYFTENKSTDEEWSYIFMIGAVISIGTAIIFILFGSGNTQKWNEIDETAMEAKTSLPKINN